MSRFSLPPDPVFQALNASIGFDWRLAPYDVEQSRAHATMLAATGIITDADRDALLSGLDRVAAELDAGEFPFLDSDEDIHMAVERRLTEIVGAVGGKLHTARSRNDQVATDMAMFTRAHALRAIESLQDLQTVVVRVAEAHLDWAMPGYTHLQRAQPVYLSHHLLAYFWMFRRDAGRFETVLGSTTELPLGAGALAGRELRHRPPARGSEALGFAGVAPNSIDAVSNRDFVLDFLAAASTCATHLSRLGAEIVLWSSEEFGFCEVSRRVGLELLDHAAEEEPGRGRAAAREGAARRRAPDRAPRRDARPPADLQQGHAGGQGAPVRRRRHARALPAGRARDARAGSTFRRDRLADAATDEMLAAVDVADMLVKRGVPFRQSHGVVAGLVREAVESGRTLSQLTREELARHSDVLDDEFYSVLSQGSWLESKVSEGGTALDRVREQLAHARAALDSTT